MSKNNHNSRYDIVCIGNYTKDTIITPAGVSYVDGGAINYASHAAVRLGLKVAVVTRLAEEDKRVVDIFTDSGIDCYPTYTPSSTLMKLDYPTANPDIRKLSVANTAGSITVEEVAEVKEMKAAVIGTSFRGEVGLDVIKEVKERNILVAADAQGFARVLVGEDLVKLPWEQMEETLPYIDIFKADAVEAEFLTGEADIYKAVDAFAQLGPKEVVLTHKDGLLIYADGEYYALAFYPQKMNGRSGRGDTCLGSYTAKRLTKGPEEASIWAAAVTSLKMEEQGPFHRDIRDVEALIEQKYH